MTPPQLHEYADAGLRKIPSRVVADDAAGAAADGADVIIADEPHLAAGLAYVADVAGVAMCLVL